MASKLLFLRVGTPSRRLGTTTKEGSVMRAIRNRELVALAVGLLVLAGVGLAAADNTSGETIRLRGCLDEGADGRLTLIEQESGERIVIEGSEDLVLEDHIGHTVQVTGQWVEDKSQYRSYFKVSAVDMLSDTCES
jgi:hypothetical protein